MLLIEDKWLLLGPNRHGTTYCKNVLENAFRGRTRMCTAKKHWPLCKIPAELREGRIIVGIIRCPLRWYVSKWRRFWDDSPEKRYGFEEYFHKHWNNPHGPIGKNMEDMPVSPADIGAWSYKHIAFHCLDARNALANLVSRGALSGAYPSLLSVDELICTETLRSDLPRVFGDHVNAFMDQDSHSATHSSIERGVNTASREHQFASFYTPELLGLVKQGDGWLTDHYPNLDYHKFMEGKSCS